MTRLTTRTLRGPLRWFVPALAVVGTGLISALCISLMTAGWVSAIERGTAAQLGVFIAVQVLGVTVAKFGLDSFVFAKASADPSIYLFDLRPSLGALVAPATLVVAGVAFVASGEVAQGSVFLASVLTDAYSAIRIAELTARRRFVLVAIGNLAKYPLYFILVFAGAAIMVPTYESLLYLFAIVSVFRSGVLALLTRASPLETLPAFGAGLLAVQQALNYLLFRIDQVGVPLLSSAVSDLRGDSLSEFVFLVKFAEISSYFATAVGSLVFPSLLLRWGSAHPHRRIERLLANVLLWLLLQGLLLAYVWILWPGEPPGAYLLPIGVAAALSLEVNFRTFHWLRENRLVELVSALGSSVVIGLGIAVLAMGTESMLLVYWIVPAQMVTFLAFRRSRRSV